MEYDEITKTLSHEKRRLVGLKQVLRALEDGRAAVVVLADDADDHIRRRIQALCQMHGVTCVEGPVMAQLGAQCRLSVGAAVACVLKTE